MNSKKQKPIIGKNDIADFPKFGLSNIKVKIDSGAYTSSIHCSLIKEIDDCLEVVFLSKKVKGYTGEKLFFNNFTVKRVKSSSGEAQLRYKIKGDILLFNKKYNTEFTLSKRSEMRYPVLLGRKLLNKKFLIDTSLSNQSFNIKTEKNQ